MIEIAPCTSADLGVVADLWNVQRQNPDSCWSTAPAVNAVKIERLRASGETFVVARDSGTPVGFGMWSAAEDPPEVTAVAAADDGVYYRLLLDFCQWASALGATTGYAELDARATIERARMDALEVIAYTPIAYEPLAEGQDASQRVPVLWRASCDLASLIARLTVVLEGLS